MSPRNREDSMEEQKVSAAVSSSINIDLVIGAKRYILMVPNASSHEEAKWACEEFGRLIDQLKEQTEAAKAKAEAEKAENAEEVQ